MRGWECETRTAAGYLALKTLRYRQIRWESHRSVIYIPCTRTLQVQSCPGPFYGVCGSKHTFLACPLLPRLPPTASSCCEWTVGGRGLCWSLAMPSFTNLVDGVMTPLELRDFSRDSSGRRCSARGLLCLNQRCVERPKPTRDLQPPRERGLFLLDNSPEITSPGLFAREGLPVVITYLGQLAHDSLRGPPTTQNE